MPRRRVSRRIDARRPPGGGRMFFPADLRTADTARHDAHRTSAARPPAPASAAARRGDSGGGAMGVARRHAGATPRRQRPRLSQRPRHRLGDRRRTRHRAGALRPHARVRPRPFVRDRQPRARRRQRRGARRRPRVAHRHPAAPRHHPATALPGLDRRRRGQRRSTRTIRSAASRSRARRCASGSACATTSTSTASARRPGTLEQARPAARRLQLHDVEQRHLRLRRAIPIRSTCRSRSIIVMRDGRDARRLPRQHLPQQLRRRPHESPGLLSFGADGGDLDYYFIYGPDSEARDRALHRRSPGACRCRRAGRSAITSAATATTRSRASASSPRNFRERRIPADVIWLDIHYQDGYKPFTWDRERFPDPAAMVADLRARRLPHRADRRRPPEEGGRLRAVRHRPRRRSLREEPGRQRLRWRRSGRRRRRRIRARASSPTSASPRRASGGAASTRCSPTSASPASGTT